MKENIDERIDKLGKKLEILEEKVNHLEGIIKQIELSQSKKESFHRLDITLCIGYYLQYVENYNFFTSEDIKKGYKRIYKPLPKNLTDTIVKNVLRGFMEKREEGKNGKKSWYVTEEGKKYVESMGKGEK
jgi:hypothetical protein